MCARIGNFGKPDVVIPDWMMPMMEGAALADACGVGDCCTMSSPAFPALFCRRVAGETLYMQRGIWSQLDTFNTDSVFVT